MDTHVGDRLIVEGNRVGNPRRCGTIIDVLGQGSGSHYRVQWDDGHESIFFPTSSARTLHQEAQAIPKPSLETTHVELRIVEDDYHTEAWATLRTRGGTFTGRGDARRHPVDPSIPLVGEELAVARALVDLAEELRQAAGQVIGSGVSPEGHLVQ